MLPLAGEPKGSLHSLKRNCYTETRQSHKAKNTSVFIIVVRGKKSVKQNQTPQIFSRTHTNEIFVSALEAIQKFHL